MARKKKRRRTAKRAAARAGRERSPKRPPPEARERDSEPTADHAPKRAVALAVVGWLLAGASFATLFAGGWVFVRALGRPGDDGLVGGPLLLLSSVLKLVGVMYAWERDRRGLWLYLLAEAALVAGAVAMGWRMLSYFGAPMAVVVGTVLWLAITSAPAPPRFPDPPSPT